MNRFVQFTQMCGTARRSIYVCAATVVCVTTAWRNASAAAPVTDIFTIGSEEPISVEENIDTVLAALHKAVI